MTDVTLSCSCGTISGVARHVSASTGTRIICHCDDCQTFANYLGSGNILDKFGGTDIYQMPLSYVEITSGADTMKCIRLKPNGLIRWYAGCCNTPIGNTISANMPSIGVIHSFMDDRYKYTVPVRGYTYTNGKPCAEREKMATFGMILHIFSKLIIWKIKGLNKPSAFFDRCGNPVTKPKSI